MQLDGRESPAARGGALCRRHSGRAHANSGAALDAVCRRNGQAAPANAEVGTGVGAGVQCPAIRGTPFVIRRLSKCQLTSRQLVLLYWI